MSVSLMRLIKYSIEFLPQNRINEIQPHARGLYVLYQKGRGEVYSVVYIGIAHGLKAAGMRGRLKQHVKQKGKDWTHCSVFEVWDNISQQEVKELEGILRHLYRYDPKANSLNKQLSYKPLNQIRKESEKT